MKALLRNSDTPRDFSLGTAPEPSVAPGLVKIKVACAGICGSDLHIYLGQDPGLELGVGVDVVEQSLVDCVQARPQLLA